MPSFSTMLNQLSALPDFSSTCSHKPVAVGSLATGAARTAVFNAITAPIVIEIRSFIATSSVVIGVPPTTFMAGDCGDLPARSTCGWCPASEVRDTSQQPLTRTSEAKGYQQA